MRIEGWQADGFGILHDQGVDGLGAGVTVLLGENEAGKSTQLAFLRAVLFGFADRRTSEPPYTPLRGGAHGGLIVLRDGADRRWRVERYAEKKRGLKVVRPDGAPGDAADLATILCGVDRELFKSVYAFDLDQLLKLEALDSEAIRDRIFSEAITGGGVSARSVTKALERRQAELLKERMGASLINDRLRQILAKDEELREAERQAAGYAGLLEDEAAQEEVVRERTGDLDELRERRARLAKLIELQPALFDSNDLAEELAKLPLGDEALPARVATLVDDLTALTTLEGQAGAHREAQRTAENDMSDALERLGSGWSVERVRRFEASVAVRDELDRWEETLDEVEGALRDREARAEEAAAAAAERRAELERAEAAMPADEPPPQAETGRLRETLIGLRADLAALELAEVKAAAAPAPRRVAPLAWAFAAVAAVAAGLTAALVDWRLGAALAAAAVLFAVLGYAGRPGAVAPPGAQGETEGQPVIGLRKGIAEAALQLGLPSRPTAAQLGAREAELAEQLALRADWDGRAVRLADLRTAVQAATGKGEQASGEAREAQRRREEAVAAWQEWATVHDLGVLRPAAAIRAFDAVETGKRADRAVHAATARLDDIVAAADSWAARAEEALSSAGLDPSLDGEATEFHGIPRTRAGQTYAARSDDAALPSDDPGLRSAVKTLHAQLTHRAEAENTLRQLQQQLERGLGPAEQASAALAELASGDATEWQAELDGLDERIKAMQAERDEAVEARRVAHDARVELERSAYIPTLQAERASLVAQLAQSVREYRVLATAQQLIGDTFKRYARERQPDVLADASRDFAAVTGGAYVRVDPFDPEGVEGIVVVSAGDDAATDEQSRTGEPLATAEQVKTPEQLSRGTREQLYVVMRLALASDLARRRTPPEQLPLLMDDCLVNFDPQRAAATVRLLVAWARDGQCLLFTCHPETADLLLEVSDGTVKVIQLGTLDASAATPA